MAQLLCHSPVTGCPEITPFLSRCPRCDLTAPGGSDELKISGASPNSGGCCVSNAENEPQVMA